MWYSQMGIKAVETERVELESSILSALAKDDVVV